jgi:hypothetical protein
VVRGEDKMDTEIIIALIMGIGGTLSGLAAILSAILLHRKTVVLLEYRMGQVEKKLDSHNGYAKLFSETSEQIAGIEKDIAVIKTSLQYIQKEVDDEK